MLDEHAPTVENDEPSRLREEVKYLRDKNHELSTKIVAMELGIAKKHQQWSETWELNEVLQKRLKANGLSPCIVPTADELEQARLAEPLPAPAQKSKALMTLNMRQALSDIVTGKAVNNGHKETPRERSARGRTLDSLQARGLLDSSYQPTPAALSLFAPAG